jgi:hypothetical protein
MIYFGASDGMLHAACGSIQGECTQYGQELWAYVPRVNLPNLRYNTAKVDGSPRVVDVYGDWDGTGLHYSWKTVLTFQTGTGDATTSANTYPAGPAVYALDVTNPENPTVLWEYTTPASRTAHELGVGMTLVSGSALVGTATKNLVVAQTNNGGTGSAGIVVKGLSAETGAVQWTFSYDYPSTDSTLSRGGSISPAVPSTGVPGGAVSIDTTVAGGNGYFTNLLVPDLYGDLWLLNPDGTNTLGTIPLFKLTTNYHPITKPAIFSKTTGGTQYAAFTDGGYYDTIGATGWGNNTTTHYLMGVKISTTATTTLTETSAAASIPIKIQLDSGEKGYSQAVVVGDQVFATAETASVNSTTYGTTNGTGTAHVYGADFSGSSQVTQASGASAFSKLTVVYGASSIAASGTALYDSSGSKQQLLSSGATGTTGHDVTATVLTDLTRKLWLRTK